MIALLNQFPRTAEYYRHFITPGHILTELMSLLKEDDKIGERIIRHFVVTQFEQQQYTKLEQAGLSSDKRPTIEEVFIDVPYLAAETRQEGMTFECMAQASSRSHRLAIVPSTSDKSWGVWGRRPEHAAIWFIRGGPGRGKSTLGQYFAQVQRAALIEGDKLIPIQPTTRVAASTLLQVASGQFSLPEYPRIPVQIDLKDYAGWLAKLTDSASRGILSYLSATLEILIEEPVATSLLRKLISSKSWFMCFDGLDEVPGPIKDEVAEQIKHFFENVVTEARGDVYAICTSRPQGYSGQFDTLNCAAIDLTNLTPSQALKCAKPILSLDRSIAEARAAFDRLVEAISNEAVQQLMVTPLQSHIMAIVVRDGGKPPERRWNLFRTFYYVIKRRESNKSFADPRLARVLREDNRLLESIHNRLGFSLHARAEQADGAEAFLSRPEFADLVRNTVTGLLETDIDETVRTLIEATTERLVLVSTPDSGDQVRFDIRQLQEFFAGQFLYEDVTSEQIRERLSVVAGDSHWREAVQFCISALVEGGRTTDCLVAANILMELDAANTFIASDLVARRYARGALVAATLLSEGVLEQSKSTREIFGKSLQPLLASVNDGELDLLSRVTGAQSRAWLRRFLINALQDMAPSENIGAAIVLTYLLDDTAPEKDIISTYLIKAPINYSAFVVARRLSSFHRHIGGDGERRAAPPHWVMELGLRVLARPDWFDRGDMALPWLLAGAIARSTGKPETSTITAADGDLWALRNYHDSYPIEKEKVLKSNWPGLKANLFVRDWLDVFGLRRRNLNIPSTFSYQSGFFKVAKTIVDFATAPSAASIRNVAKALLAEESGLRDIVQSSLIGLIPIDLRFDVSTQLRRFIEMSTIDFEDFVASLRGGAAIDFPAKSVEIDFSEITNESWRLISARYPTTAARALVTALRGGANNPVQREPNLGWRDLAHIWRTAPKMMLRQFSLVGKVAKEVPPNDLDELVSNLVEFAINAPKKQVLQDDNSENFIFPDEHMEPFAMRLPEQTVLLEAALVAIKNAAFARRIFAFEGANPAEMLLKTWAKAYVRDPAMLEQTALEGANSEAVRFAASILLAIHPDANSASACRLVHVVYSAFNALQMDRVDVVAAIEILSAAQLENDPYVVKFLETLLEFTKPRYWVRAEISSFMSGWRERSVSPVSARRTGSARWLD